MTTRTRSPKQALALATRIEDAAACWEQRNEDHLSSLGGAALRQASQQHKARVARARQVLATHSLLGEGDTIKANALDALLAQLRVLRKWRVPGIARVPTWVRIEATTPEEAYEKAKGVDPRFAPFPELSGIELARETA
jgi:hypothetical protein